MKNRLQLDIDINEIIKLYNDELWNIAKIAKHFNVNYGTIKLRLIKSNIKLRSHSESKKIVMNDPDVKLKTSKASKESQEKRKETNLKKYGHEVPSNALKEEWQKKHLNKYGVKWSNQRNDIKEKRKETNLKKYGVENVSHLKEIQNKIKLNRWINKDNSELNLIQDKIKNKFLEKYGFDNCLKNPKIKNKLKNSRWILKTKDDLELINYKSKQTHFKNFKLQINDRLIQLNLKLITPFKNVTDLHEVQCLKCNTNFNTILDYIFHGYGLCPKCFPSNISNFEKEIIEYLNDLNIKNLLFNNREIIKPKEIDIYIPDKKLAIECNGLYWHSEKHGIGLNYHLSKTNECEKQGIQLIHIFEDEWLFKQDIVKSRLKQILKLNLTQRIHARKCQIKEIDSNLKNNFLERFHIQGKDNSIVKLGAFYNDELVSVMTFAHGNISKGSKSIDGVWELNRFVTNNNYHIPGIASKLLKYFELNYSWNKIFSYADRRWSQGNLYQKLKFQFDSYTQPNYWYIKQNKRIHRFNLRKKINESKDIPEWILRQNEGYYRIWDCGNLKYTKTKKC